MPTIDSITRRATFRSVSSPRVLLVRRTSRIEPGSRRFVLGVALGVGLVSFLITELMHYLLVPNLGRHHERLLAEGMSAFVLTFIVAQLANIHRRQHRLTVARAQVIAEVNHHIRNALTPISLSVDATDNQQLSRVISEAVEHIDWALREILPREIPLRDQQRDQLGYFQTGESGQ